MFGLMGVARMAGQSGGELLPDLMVIEVASGYLYARFAWDATYDVVQRMAVTAVSPSATTNGVVQPSGFRRIPIATSRTGMIAAFDAAIGTGDSFAGNADDAPPVKYNNTYIGGNHGAAFAKKITAVGHGKTVADIGSQWVSAAAVTFYIIRIVDADNIWVLSNNTGANAERWSFNTTLAAPAALTHVAGATNTATINFTASVTQQIFPAVQNLSRKIYKNGTQELTVDGVYDVNHVSIVESYGIANVAAMLDYLIAGRPWASTPDLNSSSIATQVSIAHTYTIRENGSMTVDGRFENLQTIGLSTSDGYVGFVQSNPIGWQSGGNVETLNYYVPRVAPIVGSVKTWDFDGCEVIFPATVELIGFPAATWDSATNPPDRMAQFVTTTATGVKTRGYVMGYSRLSGAGADMDNYVIKSGFFSSARKMYTHILTKEAPVFGAPADVLAANSVVAATAYRIPYNLADIPEATVAAVRLTSTGAEVILDFHQSVTAYAVPVPTKLNGKTATIVDSQGGISLDSATVAAGAITVTVTGGRGSAVLSVA